MIRRRFQQLRRKNLACSSLFGVCRQKETGRRKVCRVFQGRNSSGSVVFSFCMFWREKIGGSTAVSCVERSEWMRWRLLV